MSFLAMDPAQLYRPLWKDSIMRPVVEYAKKYPGKVPEVWLMHALKTSMSTADLARLKHPYPNKDPEFVQSKERDLMGHIYRLYMSERHCDRIMTNDEQAFVLTAMQLIHKRQQSESKSANEMHPTVQIAACLALCYRTKYGLPTPESYVDTHLTPYIDVIPESLYRSKIGQVTGTRPQEVQLSDLIEPDQSLPPPGIAHPVYDSVNLWGWQTSGFILDDHEYSDVEEENFDSEAYHNFDT